MVGYFDAGYMSDPHNARSQTGFVFLCGGVAISWRSVKQTLVITSTNHSEITVHACKATAFFPFSLSDSFLSVFSLSVSYFFPYFLSFPLFI